MMNDLNKLSGLLDEHIEKGMKLDRKDRIKKSSRIELYEESISKGLSFDPFQPIAVTEDSPYYNPYAQHPMGGYYPHSTESWAAQGNDSGARHVDGYRTVNEFYRVAGDEPMNGPRMVQIQSQSRFAQLRKSVDDLIKAGPVPVGTTHTYADGQTYKKVAEGKWVASAGLEHKKTQKFLKHKDPSVRSKASHGIEQHASKKQAVEGMIKQRNNEQKVIGEAKNQAVQAAASHTKEMMGKLYDGKPPKAFNEAHEKIMAEHGAKKVDPKAALNQAGEGLKPKTHNVHVGFKHQGKDYTHKFEGVHAGTHQEAIQKVQEILKQKLPGHQLSSVRAETPKPKPEATMAKKPSGEASV